MDIDRKDREGLTALQYAGVLDNSDCAAAILLAGGQLPLSLHSKLDVGFSRYDASSHHNPKSPLFLQSPVSITVSLPGSLITAF